MEGARHSRGPRSRVDGGARIALCSREHRAPVRVSASWRWNSLFRVSRTALSLWTPASLRGCAGARRRRRRTNPLTRSAVGIPGRAGTHISGALGDVSIRNAGAVRVDSICLHMTPAKSSSPASAGKDPTASPRGDRTAGDPYRLRAASACCRARASASRWRASAIRRSCSARICCWRCCSCC